jgi:hypothetical protein
MSCATVRSVKPDGSSLTYKRIGNQQIASLTIINTATGEQIQLVGQSAQNDDFIKSIAEGVVNELLKLNGVPR